MLSLLFVAQEFFRAKQVIDVQEGDQAFTRFGKATDELGIYCGSKVGRFLDSLISEVENVGNSVDHKTDDLGSHIHDDDHGELRVIGRWHVEFMSQVDDGYHGAAQVHNPLDACRHVGDWSDLREVANLLHSENLNTKLLAVEGKREELIGIGDAVGIDVLVENLGHSKPLELILDSRWWSVSWS